MARTGFGLVWLMAEFRYGPMWKLSMFYCTGRPRSVAQQQAPPNPFRFFGYYTVSCNPSCVLLIEFLKGTPYMQLRPVGDRGRCLEKLFRICASTESRILRKSQVNIKRNWNTAMLKMLYVVQYREKKRYVSGITMYPYFV